MFNSPDSMLRLANGVGLPSLTCGTWHATNYNNGGEKLRTALRLGYRSFDSAQVYGNGQAIADALAAEGIARSDVFLTSKIWVTHRSFDAAIEAFEHECRTLGTDYLDLLLIHWPSAHGPALSWQSQNAGSWRALEHLYETGRVRAIGVSNFLVHHLVPLLARAKVMPMVNQLELHAGYTQAAAVNFCRKKGIAVQSWGPFGRGALLKNLEVLRVAQRYGVSSAQVLIRWCLDLGLPTIPRSFSPEHLKANLDVFGFSLSGEDVAKLCNITPNGFSGMHPDTVSF